MEYEPIHQLADYNDYQNTKPLFNKPISEKEFLQELFDFNSDIEKLAHIWNGDIVDDVNDKWLINTNPDKQIMNQNGIHWCKNKMKNFACKYYVVTSFDKTEINQMMMIQCKDINHELSKRYIEFGFKDKLDIQSVWSNMIASILAIFKGSFADAQRKLLGSTNTYQVIEHKDTTPQGGWFKKGGNPQ